MTALADKRKLRPVIFSEIKLDATASVTYYEGALACIDTSTGLVVQGKASTTLKPIGFIARNTTLGAGGGKVEVKLFREVRAWWFVQGADAIAAPTNVGGLAYILDDQTVNADDNTNTLSVLGMVWAVDSARGVLVEPTFANVDPNLSGLDG